MLKEAWEGLVCIALWIGLGALVGLLLLGLQTLMAH